MPAPYLSIVVPALNEEGFIGAFIERMRAELIALGTARVPTWEIIVVDDGSRDATRSIVEEHARRDSRVRLLSGPHRGKGAALREGMRAAQGDWRFMADADLSMPPDNLARFLAAAQSDPPPDIVIGSREAPGAKRVGEPWPRHLIGRVFNQAVRLLAVPGVHDTQCGFKLFSARAVDAIVPKLTIDGFAFDVELLFLARRAGLDVREVGIIWEARGDSRVAVGRGAAAFADILRIRWRWRNRWAAAAYVLAAAFAASFAYDLLHMPVQVYDSLGEIIAASQSPSPAASFESSLGNAGYLRPFRIYQIKALFDAADGRYWLAYRGFHAVLLLACVGLFTRALRVRTGTDFAAAAFALTVLTGLHTFKGTVNEAYPINHFLEMVVCSLLVLNLVQSAGGLVVDFAAAVVFAAAALTLESGLLVWVVAVAARLAGLRGVSWRGIAIMTLLLGGYFYLRFVYLPTGTPGLSERSSGYMFRMLDPPELQERFGDRPYVFYAYNVAASILSVLAGEPQAGVFVAVGSWLDGEVRDRSVIAIATCLLTTMLLMAAAVSALRGGMARDRGPRLLFVFAAVLGANAVLSYAYTKDEIMSVAGAFYAVAAYVAVRWALTRSATATWPAVAALAVVLPIAASGWAVRSVGLHHVLRTQAFKHRNDWAVLPGLWQREGRWPEPGRERELILKLRADAIAMPVPNPYFEPDWADDVWGE